LVTHPTERTEIGTQQGLSLVIHEQLFPNLNQSEHAARQLGTGRWTSKLGPDEDIEHDDVDALEGDHYGVVVRIMKRRFSSSGP
jgi:hypothetical protein